jgi:hypothetical protein
MTKDNTLRHRALLALHFEKRHLIADLAQALRQGDPTFRLEGDLQALRDQYRELCRVVDTPR